MGDRAHAWFIMDRIDRVIEQGNWTTNEFNRLHQMRKAWAKRAAGTDPVFNMRGWQHKGTGHNLSPALKLLRDINKAMGK